jgi:EF-P beta-lysylation protein EpmB
MITATTPPRYLAPAAHHGHGDDHAHGHARRHGLHDDQAPDRTASRWQLEMANALTTTAALAEALGLDPLALDSAPTAFKLRVPASYVRRMRRGDPQDPLLLQVLPSKQENEETIGYTTDPVGEREAVRAPGLLQKYSGRALLICTQACAVHCRYCFRREFPYADQAGDARRWSAALEEIARDQSLEEIILSGGDPLSLTDARLKSLTDALADIPHVRRLRVHTRQPVVLPSRVDSGLLAWIGGIRRPMVFVIHCNHPNEIDSEVREACGALRHSGVTLLNQSVLLRGVNDSTEVLAELSGRLFDAGVLPYYLHVLDRVRGAAHFDVPEATARGLLGELTTRLPGYLVPRLVREVHGAPAKVTLPAVFAK